MKSPIVHIETSEWYIQFHFQDDGEVRVSEYDGINGKKFSDGFMTYGEAVAKIKNLLSEIE
jgi:hypothetical protein